MLETVLVTGGAGYVGATLVPRLLRNGFRVRVLDLYIYGDVLEEHPNLKQIRGDIRDWETLDMAIRGCDAVVHLAAISNDPSFELNPALARSINYAAFFPLVALSKKHGVKRFVFASSASVYGVKEEDKVTEDLPLEPLTDYSKYKMLCERVLSLEQRPGFETVIVRPASVCGYSPRMRLDLVVNTLTAHAVCDKKILVFGGEQMRPGIHIADMARLYTNLLFLPSEAVDGKVFNAGFENHKVIDLATMVRDIVGSDVEIEIMPSDDDRSYRVSSEKLVKELGFRPDFGAEDAIRDLVDAFAAGLLPNAMTDIRYHNIKTMQELGLE